MSDDWLKEFDLDGPDKKSDESSDIKKPEIALDSLGIPILDEVVILEEDYALDDEISFNSIPEPSVELLTKPEETYQEPSFELPTESADVVMADQPVTDTKIQYEVLREQLRLQLKQDLEAITGSLAKSVAANLSKELELQIQTELKQALDSHLDNMINKAIQDISENNDSY